MDIQDTLSNLLKLVEAFLKIWDFISYFLTLLEAWLGLKVKNMGSTWWMQDWLPYVFFNGRCALLGSQSPEAFT